MTAERVRFAPSPTGYLHIGGVRTALYNWLWARQTKGTFILRIEDTDTERSTAESTQVILDAMKWLDLDWDEGPGVGGPNGPYFQTERVEIYKEFADRMIERGTAYRCYATKEELDAERERQTKAGNPFFRYPGTWRDKGPKDWPTDGRPYVVRLKSPKSGSTGWVDLVKGRIDVPNEQQQDVVLIRSNGIPLYNFGAAIDDITMGVTLVARGDDHVVNTPVQILIYEALGKTPPKLAHLPMINGPDGKKLSKRNAAVSVAEYRDMGFLPDAVLNYLARLGWSHGDQEIFTRGEMIQHFDWSHVGRTAAQYDLKKFQFVQSSHLRAVDEAKLAELARPYLKAGATIDSEARLHAAIGTVKTRATTLLDVGEMVDFYFRDTLSFDEKAVAKFLVPAAASLLGDFRAHLAAQPAFDRASLEAATTAWLTERGLQIKDVAQAARVSLTGKSQSPGLYEVLEVLGRERALARLEAGAHKASQAAST
ncbi:MAG: glutamate--tRNA ligase [Sandaracinaceae bacterium]|nr:glutamate--tRNA ligase [Sandaracinaceae bacterium]